MAAVSSKKSSSFLPSQEALNTLIDDEHKKIVFTRASIKEPTIFTCLDGPIGTQNCQWTSVISLVILKRLGQSVSKLGLEHIFPSLCQAWLNDYYNDKAGCNTRTVEQTSNAKVALSFAQCQAQIEAELGEAMVSSISLAYTKTIDAKFIFSPFYSQLGIRYSGDYIYSTEQAEKSKKQADGVDIDWLLKTRLMKAVYAVTLDVLGSYETSYASYENDTIKAFKTLEARIKAVDEKVVGHEEDLVVREIWILFRIAYLIIWREGLQCLLTVRCKARNDKGQSSFVNKDAIVQILVKPREDGLFTYKLDPENKDRNEPSYRINMFVNYKHGDPNANTGERIRQLVKDGQFDLLTCTDEYAADHPPVTEKAEGADTFGVLWKLAAISSKKQHGPALPAKGWAGGTMAPSKEDDKFQALNHQYAAAALNGRGRYPPENVGTDSQDIKVAGAHASNKVTIHHVDLATWDLSKEQMEDVIRKHEAAGFPWLGPYYVRSGSTTLCVDTEEEARLLAKLSETERKNRYLGLAKSMNRSDVVKYEKLSPTERQKTYPNVEAPQNGLVYWVPGTHEHLRRLYDLPTKEDTIAAKEKAVQSSFEKAAEKKAKKKADQAMRNTKQC
jgi:hypothetical protein